MKKLLFLFLFVVSISFANQEISNLAATVGQPHNAKATPYVEVYAHRGARSFAPENTLPGYKTGLKIGLDWVDMDICVTKDNVVLVYHDIWLNPDIVSNKGVFWAKSKEDFIHAIPANQFDKVIQSYLVHNLTLQQLKKFEVGILNPHSSYAKYFPEQISVPGTSMPTLQEVIDYVNRVTHNHAYFQIEFKTDPEHPTWTVPPKQFAMDLYQVLKKNHLENRVEVQSFDWRTLFELQKLDKKIKTAYLVTEEDKSRMLNPDPKHAGLWSGGKLLKDYNNSLPQMVKALGGACYEPEDVLLTKKDLDEAHKLGLKVVVWRWPEHTGSAFDFKLTADHIKWGVDGIITDDPGQLISMLAARNQRVPQAYRNS